MPCDPHTPEASPPVASATPSTVLGGIGWRVAGLALVVAVALIGGLAWSLLHTQAQGRDTLRDAMQRRAALTANLIGSTFMDSIPPEQATADFGGSPRALRTVLEQRLAVSRGRRLAVLDASGRVLAAAGEGTDVRPARRPAGRLVLRGTASLSDAFEDGTRRVVVEIAVPFDTPSGRRVVIASNSVKAVQDFTDGFFLKAAPFQGTQGYLLDGRGRTLSSIQTGRAGVPLDPDAALVAATARRAGSYGDRTLMTAAVPSSRWTVVFSVPNASLFESVNGSPADAAWLVLAAFTAAVLALLSLGYLAAKHARRLAAATERAHAAATLAYERLHDPLTGLPNRALFAQRAEHALAAARRRGGSVAIIFMDVDHYKRINDSLGHEAGDEVLREIARRLTASVRDADTVSRFGGDEFVILCEDVSGVREALVFVERIRAGLHPPMDIGGRSIAVTFSIGVVTGEGGDAEHTAAQLVADADAAMYRAKEAGRGRVAVFDAVLHRQALARLDAEAALRDAVEHEQFVLHYQPIVRIAAGGLYGVEALVRWRRPGVEALVQPADFVELAEELGLISDVGAWALRTAMADAGAWAARGLIGDDFVLAVNVSAHQLADPRLPALLAESLADWDRPADRLLLEITETAVMADPAGIERRLEALRALGVRLALDSFGSGYSSLGQLARSLPMSVLKLDRSFIAGMSGPRERGIVASAAALARALELSSIAVGVETAEQVSDLAEMGFHYAQGHYFGTPVDAQETVRRLGSGRFARRGRVHSPGV